MSSAPNKLQTIAELRKLAPGAAFKTILVVTSFFQKNDKNGKPYYEMSACDSTGVLEAKIWSDAVWFDKSAVDIAAPARQMSAEEIKSNITGRTVGIDGKTSEFRGSLQFSFNKLTLLNQENFPPAQYLPRSPFPINELESRYEVFVSACRPEVAGLLRSVLSAAVWNGFRDLPAAVSHHHAYANGLLEHSLSVTDCAKSMAEAFNRSGYEIDTDVVVAGALLHDLGKIESYTMKSVPEVTLEGAVLDHIALGYSRFVEASKNSAASDSLKLQLAHILLSHHGMREYGSPVVPATPEALIVSAADELDFKVFCWREAVKDLTEEQPISQWHAATGRRYWNR